MNWVTMALAASTSGLINQALINPAPQIIPALTDPANLLVSILLAIATFLVFLAALFQEWIRQRFKAVLNMEIRLAKPDCQQIELLDDYFVCVGRLFYIRIRVSHKKGPTGENVEIIPTHFWRVNNQNQLSEVEYFFPISLVWSNSQPKTSTMRVPAGLLRYCDFGYLKKDMRSGQPKALLILNTIVKPTTVAGGELPNVIGQGKFQFELLLSGDNVKPLRKKWEIEFDKWSDDEKQMLNENVKIREVK